MDTNTFDIGRADTALKNARDAVVASKTAPVKPVTPVDPSISRGGAQPLPTSTAAIMGQNFIDQNKELGARIYRVAAPLLDPIRTYTDPVARTVGAIPATVLGSALDAGKEMIARGAGVVSPSVEQSIRRVVAPAPSPVVAAPVDASAVASPAPAVAADPRGYVEVGGKREYIDGSTQVGTDYRPGNVRVGSDAEMEQFRRAKFGDQAPAAPAPAAAEVNPQDQRAVMISDFRRRADEMLRRASEMTVSAGLSKQQRNIAITNLGRLQESLAQQEAALLGHGIQGDSQLSVARESTKSSAAIRRDEQANKIEVAKVNAGRQGHYDPDTGEWMPGADTTKFQRGTTAGEAKESEKLDEAVSEYAKLRAKPVVKKLFGASQDDVDNYNAALAGYEAILRKNGINPDTLTGGVTSSVARSSSAATGRPSNVDEAMVMAKKSGAKSFTFGGKNYQVQ